MEKLTTKEWKEFEDSITLFSPGKLMVDGYKITIELGQSGMKLNYYIYINGVMSFKEMGEKKERFWFPSKRRLHKKNAFKGVSKQMLKKYGWEPDKKIVIYTPVFASFRTLKSTLIKNNENIRLYTSEDQALEKVDRIKGLQKNIELKEICIPHDYNKKHYPWGVRESLNYLIALGYNIQYSIT